MRLLTPMEAISTLLQPPIVRTGLPPHATAPESSAHKPPTARDIPPVTLTNITHVDAVEFKPYLTQFSTFYEESQGTEGNWNEAADVLSNRSREADQFAVALHDGSLRPGKRPAATRKRSMSSVSSFLPMEVDVPTPIRRWGSESARRATQDPPPLSTIPTVYFETDFHLENPRTFDVVTERSEVVPPQPGPLGEKKGSANGSAGTPRKPLATNVMLQEKLSWCIDTVEMHLIASISTAPTSFSAALGSLRDLHTEATNSVERMKALRNELHVLDQEIAINGLRIAQKRQRSRNLHQLQDAIL